MGFKLNQYGGNKNNFNILIHSINVIFGNNKIKNRACYFLERGHT